MDAECRYRKTAKITTKLTFKGRFALETEQVSTFTNGNLKKIKLYPKIPDRGVIAEVKFSSQFQAYAAKIVWMTLCLKVQGLFLQKLL